MFAAFLLFAIGSFVVTFDPELMAMAPEDRSAVLKALWKEFPAVSLIPAAVPLIIMIVRRIRRKLR